MPWPTKSGNEPNLALLAAGESCYLPKHKLNMLRAPAMRILLPLILFLAISACAQTEVQTLDQKRQMIMEWRDQKARNMDGINLDNLWPGERAGELNKHTMLYLGKIYAAGKYGPANSVLANFFLAPHLKRIQAQVQILDIFITTN
jgi:hypothetical protein